MNQSNDLEDALQQKSPIVLATDPEEVMWAALYLAIIATLMSMILTRLI